MRLWMWDDPRTPEYFLQLIERKVLPLLQAVQSLEDFARFADKERFPWYPLELHDLSTPYVDAARGKFESALATCERLATGRSRDCHPDFDVPRTKILDELRPLLLADDRAGLAKFLHECEAFTVKNLKLEAVWEPTPFPFEMQPAA